MAGPKYYDRIRQLQADRWSVYPFNFKDLADGSRAGRAGLWLFQNPSFVTKILRTFLPVLKLGKFVIATRFDDVREILDTHDVFDVPFGLEMMETSGGANFVLGMKSGSEGQDYERQKRFMNAAFLHGDIETIVKPMAARFAHEILDKSAGRVNAVRDLITRVSTKICEGYYGIPIPDEDAFAEWTIAMSVLFFADPFGKESARRVALSAAPHVRRLIDNAISEAKAGRVAENTVLGRLMRLQQAGTDGPDDAEIRAILAGMTTGFTPTDTVAGGHMLSVVLEKPEALAQALKAAKEDRDADLWRILVEAMRLRPLNFGPFRFCNRDYTLKSGRRIPAGCTVLASTLSAMRDPRHVPHPTQFDATRSRDQYMLFGHGMHACYGAMIADAHITQTLKALFKRPGFRAAPGVDGTLQRVGAIPNRLMVEFDISLKETAGQSMITICAPLKDVSIAGALEDEIKRLGNPATKETRAAFEAAGCIHFASLSVIRGGDAEPTYAVLEMSADGKQNDAIRALASAAEQLLRPIFAKGCGLKPTDNLASFLIKYAVDVGYRKKTAGLLFPGTPGLTVQRIKREEALSDKLTQVMETKLSRHRDGVALRLLNDVREELRKEAGNGWAFLSEPAPFLANPNKPIEIPKIFLTTRILAGIAGLVAGTALLIWLAFSAGEYDNVLVRIFAVLAALLLGIELSLFILAGLLGSLILGLRRRESADVPLDFDPDPVVVQAIMENENKHVQNHMTGVSIMKPGLFRQFTLRFMYFYITRRLALFFRPGYLNEIGTIHFARWVLLPKTRNLVFFSNYAGSWESYMEDFITKANRGLTGVWSNTIGFPVTHHLLFGGSEDGDRFKRWARRQQIPTLFWFSAYPDLACERIRVNAAIRDGFARSRTETEAVAWRSLFGSQPRLPKILEDHEVQALAFSGMGKLTQSECLLVQLCDHNVQQARAWLCDYFSTERPSNARITFGDIIPTERATFLAFTCSGLEKLGLWQGETSVLNSFPSAFTHGMTSPWRSRLLGDEGPNAPENWVWGGPHNAVDAAIILYAADKQGLEKARALELGNLERMGGRLIHRVETKLSFPPRLNTIPQDLKAVVPYLRETPSIEPFGFADGISQPLIRGTRKWYEDPSELHGVEAGEMILGYPDNRGFFPPTPQVTAKQDAKDDLPLTPSLLPGRWPQFGGDCVQAPRDLGRNGTFLAVRQLEQHVETFKSYLEKMAADLRDAWPDLKITPEWLAAKMVGRWKDGTSLVRNPSGTDRPEIDNDFLLGQDDPEGLKCPLGAHIRRANPRDSLKPGDKDQIAISNRHRIFRVGRPYVETEPGGEPKTRGLLFMCVNADIERQFEFIQQTWIAAPYYHGLGKENDPIVAPLRHDSTFTIPTHRGPITLRNMATFMTTRGGGYFFLPSRSALRFLSRPR
jgi:cytochrome P450/deferrochelatase/peroxidase EfeB